MKLLFDLTASQPRSSSKNHGGGEYCKAIFFQLTKVLAEETQVYVVVNPTVELDKDIDEMCKNKDIKKVYCKDVAEISKELQQGAYDKFYSALPYGYAGLSIPEYTKFMYTVHGIRDVELPWDKYMKIYSESKQFHNKKRAVNLIMQIIRTVYPNFYRKLAINRFRRLLNVTSNRRIITDSFHSKYSICNYFPEINSNEITVEYCPVKVYDKNISNQMESRILEQYGVEKKKFFLLIGCNRWIKNCFRATIALNKLYLKHGLFKDIKVLMIGVSNPQMYKKAIDESNVNKFLMYGYVEDYKLETFYKYAHAHIFPTLNEGFGYPPLEAMKYGTITISSAITSTTEIYGNAVLYFNPYDIEEMAIKIRESFDPYIIECLKAKMEKQYQYIIDKQNTALKRIVKYILE